MPQATVRWFDDERGFGFLALEDGADDLFVHASEIVSDDTMKSLREGQEVEFEMGEGDRGPQARNVRVTGERAAGANLGVLGTVTWYEPSKGYGFITPDGGGAEIFLHSSAIVGGGVVSEGQQVAFLVVPGEKGPQADHLLPLAAVAAAKPAASDGADGTVSWFDTEKGFGFIAPDAGKEDVFVHVRALAGGLTELSEGDRVNFDVVPGDRGPQAREVRLARGAARGRSGPSRGRPERPGSGRGGFGESRGGRADDARGGRFDDSRGRFDDSRGGRSDDRGDRHRTRDARAGRGDSRGGEGVVARYDADRGFGFISPADGGPDLFVHASVIRGEEMLHEGDRVRFAVRESDRGPQADRVERLRGR